MSYLHDYSILHVYFFKHKFPSYTFIPSYTIIRDLRVHPWTRLSFDIGAQEKTLIILSKNVAASFIYILEGQSKRPMMAWPLLQSLKRFMLYQRVLMWFVQRLNEDNQPTCRRQRLKFDELLKSVCLSREGCFVPLASGSAGGLDGW